MFKRYLWKLCWLAFALVKRGESMKKTYLVVIVLFFISTKVYTLLHNNIFFCRNSPECDLSHVLPDYREQISGTPLKYTLINTAPLAQVVVRHYELLSQHWSPDDMVTPAQWRHNVDIYIPETAKEHHALVVVNNGINYDKGVQITGKPGDFPQETLASISRDTNTIVISVSDIPNQYLTFQDDKKPLKEDESVSRSWALFMEAPEKRELMPLNIPMVTALSQAMRLAKKELTQWNINSFIITGISKRGWTTWLSAIADPDVEAIVPFAIDLLDIDASLEHIYQSYGGNWPITFYPYYHIGGWASDKVGPKTVFLIAALLWSVFCGLTGLVTGLWTMLIVRVLFGMAEGPVSAAGNKIINNWISRKESATAIGIFSAGSPLGGAVSGPIVGLLALSLGWRPAFGIIFLFGLVWVLLWYFIVSDKPTMSKRLAPEERIDFENHEDVILSDDGRATPSLGYYMKQPMVWATTLAFFSYNYILFFFLTWFPSYLNHSLHLDIKEISIATVIPWVIGAIGMVLGGVCSDVIYRITGNALLSRRLILGVCLAGAAVCVAVSGTVSTIGSAITLMSVSLFLLYLTGPIYWAVIQDVVHKDKVGSVGGAMHGLANISGIIGPLVTGFIVQFSGKYDYAFYLAGAIAIVSSLLVFVFVKSKGFKANESQSCVH